MSSMFKIQITSLEGAQVRASFAVVHPDQWDIPATKNMALQVLVNAFWVLENGFLFGPQSAPKEEILARAKNALPELRAWLELAQGRKEIISEETFNSFETDPPSNVMGWGSDGSTYYVQHTTAYDAFCRVADRVIAAVHLENEVANPRPEEDSPDPKADLLFEVSDPRLLAHLTVGLVWETAIYDFEGYRTLWENPAAAAEAVPDFAAPIRRLEPFLGQETDAGTGSFAEFTPDGAHLVLGSQTAEVVLFDVADWQERWRTRGSSAFMRVRLVDEGVSLSLMSKTETVSLEDGSAIEPQTPRSYFLSPRGTYALDYGEENGVAFLDDKRMIQQPGIVEAVAFTIDESRMALGGTYSSITVCDPASGAVALSFPISDHCSSLSFSADGHSLAACVGLRCIDIYRVSDGLRLCRLRPKGYPSQASWSPDGRHLVINHVGSSGWGGHFTVYPVGSDDQTALP